MKLFSIPVDPSPRKRGWHSAAGARACATRPRGSGEHAGGQTGADGRYILYRPLLRLAFLGNEAMARLAFSIEAVSQPNNDIPPAIWSYLNEIGFLQPDPPPPAPRERECHPTSAVILATTQCNLRCIYCYANAGEVGRQQVPAELVFAAVDHVYRNAVELGLPQFELTFHGGGEPTLAWRILQEATAHARAKDRPCKVAMVSNGIWTEQQRRWVVENLDQMTISMDGARDTQNRQRPYPSGRGSFHSLWKTIEALDRAGFNYGIRMTALAPWRGQLARDVGFLCQETGCRHIQVEPAFNSQRGGYRPPSLEESDAFADGFLEAADVAEGVGRALHYSGARLGLLTSSFCSAPYGALIVTPNGDLVSCYEITGAQHPLAELCTIGRIEGGRVTIDHAKRNALLSRLAARREACRDCFCTFHCAGDCLVKAFYPGVSPDLETNTRCRMNRRITAQLLLRRIAASADGVWRGQRTGACDSESPVQKSMA